MVQRLSELMGRKVSILLTGGAKGIVKIKGTVVDTNDDDGLITIQAEGGGMMGGGKKREMVFSLMSVIGIEVEG